MTPEKAVSHGIADDTTTILLMGSKAFSFLSDQIPKKQKLGSSRERLYPLGDLATRALVTYDLNLTNFVPEIKPDIEWDVRLAVRHALTGSIKPLVGSYHYVEDFNEVVHWADQCDKDSLNPICLDLETLGLDEFDPAGRILTIQISYKVGHSLVYRLPANGILSHPVMAQLQFLFTRHFLNFIGANLKYDMRWLAHHCNLFIENHRFDTQLVGGLLDENRFNNLKGHIKAYAPELGLYEKSIEDKWDKARMDLALAADPVGFLQYAGGDTDGCLRIYATMRHELLKDPQLARFYTRLLHPASIAFQKLETRGIVIDHPRYIELAAEAEIEMTAQSKECFAMMPNKIKYKYADNLKLSRPVIIKEFLFGPDGLNLNPTLYTEGSEKL
jgi:DNA polymerase I-like protein with 3'-5' exonuclease and polymerase domains